ncbi:hypothetical protein TNCV_600111 [Trichonephila clavipes]|nr:hypothetical protein TNCV_600111 [Trichonephila clavipes]
MLDEHSWSRTSGGVVSSHRVRVLLLLKIRPVLGMVFMDEKHSVEDRIFRMGGSLLKEKAKAFAKELESSFIWLARDGLQID